MKYIVFFSIAPLIVLSTSAQDAPIGMFDAHDRPPDTRVFIESIAFSPDGTKILTACRDMTARLWDVETDELLHVYTGHTNGDYAVAFSPSGTEMLTGSDDGSAKRWMWKLVKLYSHMVVSTNGSGLLPFSQMENEY